MVSTSILKNIEKSSVLSHKNLQSSLKTSQKNRLRSFAAHKDAMAEMAKMAKMAKTSQLRILLTLSQKPFPRLSMDFKMI